MTPGFKHNPGSQPEETKGKRVAVVLANGNMSGHVSVNSDSKVGWTANDANWTRRNFPFDIEEYKIL
jgi:hypothetical protein